MIEDGIKAKVDPAELVRRGEARASSGDMSSAIELWRQALAMDPGLAAARHALGRALMNNGSIDEAIGHLRESVRLSPGQGRALNTLGCALRQAGDIAGSAEQFAAAVAVDPEVPEPHSNLGAALYELGKPEDAVAELEKAIELLPSDWKSHSNLSLALLTCGRWDRGWPEYEWQVYAKPEEHAALPGADRPLWTGWDPAGATLLVVCEQGLGDSLQFVRYVPLIKKLGAKVVLVCQPCLKQLFGQLSFVDMVIGRGEPLPRFDAMVKMMSLPGLFDTRVDTVPADIPYLRSDPAREEEWRRKLAGPGFKVGINWEGSGRRAIGGDRSIPLSAFEPLARVPGVRLFSLQTHVGTEQVRMVADRFRVETFETPLDPPPGAFMDTAAIAAALDLVVTCDTSVAHLAGAVGARTWVALAAVADWRWLIAREDTPFYPTMRLFRQHEHGDWCGLFHRMAVELAKLAQPVAPVSPSTPIIPVSPGDLIDRMTILQIKLRRIGDPAKLRMVRTELAALSDTCERKIPRTAELDRLTVSLRTINEQLWQVEDLVRKFEAVQDFGPEFVAAARRVYKTNDLRSRVKSQINELLGAPFGDQKQYLE